MAEQIIIAIGREFGSGGHEIAEKLSELYGIKLYDKNILQNIAETKNVDVANYEKYDEVPKKMIFSRTVKGLSNSMEENIAQLQFRYLEDKANAGESFVVVGRCAETMLKYHPALVSIFVLSDWDAKVERIMRIYELTREEAESFIFRSDRKRKDYHNYYCKIKWGDSRNYDVCVNSSRLGEEETVLMLKEYIDKRNAHRAKKS